ncbi:hypothetical protein BDW02DRAFT_126743 [Decorospora gaudefroyi]|uniref:Uncharacterized protein n=1 Tax=Decorospora gaudefroyi TaxID=184978 RepID=A0A6A5JZB9_9PLEO|nr:hypothetical protein BDW02DRAFT_126743 [Decorospora gaudefroyi]
MNNLVNMFRNVPAPSPSSARYQQQSSKPRDMIRCGPVTINDPHKDFTKRFDFDESITIYGWPSRGGVIMLENASVADFQFMGLDRLHPPLLRHQTPEEEDAFSKRLLVLGAKWWDSVARHWLLSPDNPDPDIEALENSPEPTPKERHWVSVAWPSTGRLVVSEYDTNMYPGGRGDGTVPEDVCRLMLCTTMDEKATMLKERFEGKEWASVSDYDGYAFLGCWEKKTSGEAGDLLQTWPKTQGH